MMLVVHTATHQGAFLAFAHDELSCNWLVRPVSGNKHMQWCHQQFAGHMSAALLHCNVVITTSNDQVLWCTSASTTKAEFATAPVRCQLLFCNIILMSWLHTSNEMLHSIYVCNSMIHGTAPYHTAYQALLILASEYFSKEAIIPAPFAARSMHLNYITDCVRPIDVPRQERGGTCT